MNQSGKIRKVRPGTASPLGTHLSELLPAIELSPLEAPSEIAMGAEQKFNLIAAGVFNAVAGTAAIMLPFLRRKQRLKKDAGSSKRNWLFPRMD